MFAKDTTHTTVKEFKLTQNQANRLSKLLKADVDELVDEDDLLEAIEKVVRHERNSTPPPVAQIAKEVIAASRDADPLGANPLVSDALRRKQAARKMQARAKSMR